MKKIITASLLATTLLFNNAMAEEADMYVGLDLIGSSNTITTKIGSFETDRDNDSSGFKLKFGALLDEGWRLQGYYLNETYDRAIFDATNDNLNEIGLDVIKGFEITPQFSPFLQAGIGYGWMDINGYNDSSINSFSIKLGAGIMYKVTEMFELIAGLDLQARAWEDIVIGPVTTETSETSSKLYIGANLHF